MAGVAGEVVSLAEARERRDVRDRWISKQELAEYLNCSPRSIERYLTSDRYLINGERIPHRRVFGGPYQFQIGAVERWLAQVAS